MRLMMSLIAFGTVFSSFLAAAQDSPAGTLWKLNPEKSSGPVPTCVASDKGLVRLPIRVHAGSIYVKPLRPPPSECSTDVYKFEWSQDGKTMIVTQPDASFKAVFDKQ
jgi:hypothetical protein